MHLGSVVHSSLTLSANTVKKGQWRFYVGARGHSPPNLAQPPPTPLKFLDTVVLLLVELIGSIVISLKFRLAVVASQMMRGRPPQIFFPRTAPEKGVPRCLLAFLDRGRYRRVFSHEFHDPVSEPLGHRLDWHKEEAGVLADEVACTRTDAEYSVFVGVQHVAHSTRRIFLHELDKF